MQLRHDDILSHFTEFGDVKSVQLYNKARHSYGLVEFTRAESAAKASQIEFHTIAGRRAEVIVAYDRNLDNATYLDLLTDDCILKILSVKCLSATDLCSVAETSPRLKKIAGRVFRKEHKTCELNPFNDAKQTQRIIMNFGSVISELRISGFDFKDNQTRLFDSVARYFGNTLESLCIEFCVIPKNFTAKLRPIFNDLQKLSIEGCTFMAASKELFANCGSLVELELFIEDVGFILENTFPKLQQFKCFKCPVDFKFDSFISRHQNLKSLNIRNYNNLSSVLPLIAHNCKLLEELHCRIPGGAAIIPLNIGLGHLRKLNINCANRNAVKSLQGLNYLNLLESLTLERAELDSEFFGALSQLPKLQVLALKSCLGLQNLHQIGDLNLLTELEIASNVHVDLDLVLLIQRLSNLKDLSVAVNEFEIDLGTYLRIVDVVRRRPDKLTLKLNNDRRQYDDGLCRNFSKYAHLVEMVMLNV